MVENLMSTYSRLPVTFARGEGVWLWDTQGNKYLDAIAGVAVCVLGHTHPQITRAICEQAQTLIHTSNHFHVARQEQLAERLTQICQMERVFFCNSGAEANEAAIKIARYHGNQQKINIPQIIVMEQSFHGRTMATLTASGNRKVQAGFEPLVQGFIRVPYNDLSSVENIAKTPQNNVVAILVEPIQGEGGIQIPTTDYLLGLRHLCDKNNWLLMLDEIQTGMGRTGKWLAYQHYDLLPDVVTLAKGLGNGMPIGACLARGIAGHVLIPGSHGSTFGGNPLACATALAVIEQLEKEHCLENAQRMGQYLLQGFQQKLKSHPLVQEVRGCGLMLGIELKQNCQELSKTALKKGLIINVTATNVIRLLPPLILQKENADFILDTICALIDDMAAMNNRAQPQD